MVSIVCIPEACELERCQGATALAGAEADLNVSG